MLEGVADLARHGVRTGAATRNWNSYGAEVRLPTGAPQWHRDVLCDPQTNGGLLLAVASDSVDTVMAVLRAAGFAHAAPIGEMREGNPCIGVA